MSTTGDYGHARGTLTQAAGLVSEARADFTALSSRLSAQISQMQTRWGGDGATAFFALHRAWAERQRTIVAALDGFAESLTLTERANVANDERQASAMTALLHRLG